MGAWMIATAGTDDGLGPGTPAAARVPSVLHTWGRVHAVGDVDEQVARLVRVREAGWRSVLAVPEGAAWQRRLAAAASEAGMPIVRLSPATGRKDRRRAATAARVRWLSTSGIVVVHAHDEVAVDRWRSVARRGSVPLIWDVDQQAPAGAVDGRRLAASSYLIIVRAGSRLAARRMLPPNQPGAADGAGEWFDLAEHGDLAARPPATVATTVCDVYTCLTGRRPAPATDRAADATAGAIAR